MTLPNISGRSTKIAFLVSTTLAGAALATSSQAMDFHVFGDKIYATGNVVAGDSDVTPVSHPAITRVRG